MTPVSPDWCFSGVRQNNMNLDQSTIFKPEDGVNIIFAAFANN